MPQSEIFVQILRKLKYSKKERRFPEHVVAQAAIVSAAAGNLLSESLKYKYESGDIELMKSHAINTATQAIRFLQNLNNETDIKRNTDNQDANIWQESSADSHRNEMEHQMDSGEVEKS